jgi:hypothetical protein
VTVRLSRISGHFVISPSAFFSVLPRTAADDVPTIPASINSLRNSM